MHTFTFIYHLFTYLNKTPSCKKRTCQCFHSPKSKFPFLFSSFFQEKSLQMEVLARAKLSQRLPAKHYGLCSYFCKKKIDKNKS